MQSTISLMKIVMELADNHFGLVTIRAARRASSRPHGSAYSSNPGLLQAERCVPQVKERERPTCNVHEREAHR